MEKSIVLDDLAPMKKIRIATPEGKFLSIKVRNSTLDGPIMKTILGLLEEGSSMMFEGCKFIKSSKIEDSRILNVKEFRLYSCEVDELNWFLHSNLQVLHLESIIVRSNRVLDCSKAPNLQELSIESCYNLTIIISSLNRILRYILIPDQDHEFNIADTTYGYVHSLNLSNVESISPDILKYFPNLTTLYYFDNYLDDRSLQYIKGMQNLEDLRICGDNLNRFPSLPSSKSIRFLYVENSMFSDYSSLKEYQNVKELSLSNSILFDVNLNSLILNMLALESIWLNDSLMLKCPDFSKNRSLERVDISENLLCSLDSLIWILEVSTLKSLILQKNIFSMNLYILLNSNLDILKEIVRFYSEFKSNQNEPLYDRLLDSNKKYLESMTEEAWIYSRFHPIFLLFSSLNLTIEEIDVSEFLEIFGDYINFFTNWKLKIMETIAAGISTTAQIQENINMENGLDIFVISPYIDHYILQKMKTFSGFHEFEQLIQLYIQKKANLLELKQKILGICQRLFRINPRILRNVRNDLFRYYERSLLLEHDEITEYIQAKIKEAIPENENKREWKSRLASFKSEIPVIRERIALMRKFDFNEDLVEEKEFEEENDMNFEQEEDNEQEEDDREHKGEDNEEDEEDSEHEEEYEEDSEHEEEDEEDDDHEEENEEDSEHEEEDEEDNEQEDDDENQGEYERSTLRKNPYSLFIAADSFPGALKFENFIFSTNWQIQHEKEHITKWHNHRFSLKLLNEAKFEINEKINTYNHDFIKYLLYHNYCMNSNRKPH